MRNSEICANESGSTSASSPTLDAFSSQGSLCDLTKNEPITLEELSILGEFENSSQTDTDWECTFESEELTTFKSLVHSDPVVLVKAYAVLPGVPVEVVHRLVCNVETRAKWDTTFSEMRVVESQGDSDVVYCRMAAPWPVSDRDFLQWQRVQWNPVTRVSEIFSRVAVHAKCPELEGVVRAETKLAGYVLRPLQGDELTSSRIFILVQTDLKGYIPQWIISMRARTSIQRWVDDLKAAAEGI